MLLVKYPQLQMTQPKMQLLPYFFPITESELHTKKNLLLHQLREWSETGSLKYVATFSQIAEDKSAQSIPNIKAPGLLSNIDVSTIFFLTILVTCDPINTAPENSNTPAIITAFFNVKTLDPTDVAKEFAQSFAPIPQAL